MQLIAIDLLQMDNCRSVVKGVFAVKQRISNDGFTQEKLFIPIAYPLVDCLGNRSAINGTGTAHFHKKYRETGILTQRETFSPGDF